MAISAALVFISGYVLKIPVFNGYYNLEDAFVLILAYVLDAPIAAASAIGAGLCDLLSGSVPYVLPSTLIYATVGIVSSFVLRKRSFKRYILAVIISEVIVFTGYVTTFCILYGLSDFRGVSLFYVIQIGLNFITAIILYPAAVRLRDLFGNLNYLGK